MTATANGFSATAGASPAVASAGGSVVVSAIVSSAQGTTALVDLEVHGPDGRKVVQWYWDSQAFAAGQQRSYTASWRVPADAEPGLYRVSVGIFSPGWASLRRWDDGLAQIAVQPTGATATPTLTSTPTSTPTSQPTSSTSGSGRAFGVNLAGAEFGHGRLPGTYDVDYVYPNAAELDYYKSKGLRLIRLPFRWERLQQSMYAALNPTELGRLRAFVDAADARGMKVILDPHNYGRRKIDGTEYLIGSSQVPTAAFADFWRRLATEFRGHPGVWAYGLMNEPYDTGGTWPAAAQAGINAIREVDSATMILVPGDGWSNAKAWARNNPLLDTLSDPADNLVFEAHQYADDDQAGKYDASYDGEGAYPTVYVDRLTPFRDWLRSNGKRGFIGEYGVPGNDPRWLTVLENGLSFIAANPEFLGGTYWAGGPWWGSYSLSVEPSNGQDKPQMRVLTRFPTSSDGP